MMNSVLADILADIVREKRSADTETNHEFNYKSVFECPVAELRDAHKHRMECIKSANSYQLYNSKAHEKLRKAEQVINEHVKCAEYWDWYNENCLEIQKELLPELYK